MTEDRSPQKKGATSDPALPASARAAGAQDPAEGGAAAPGATGARARSWLDRALSIFTEVRAGEGRTALLLTLNVFLLLAAYYFLKTIREGLILAAGGAALKSYASAGQAILLVPFVKLYAAIARRFGRMVLITATTLFFTSNLVLFFVLGSAGVPIGIAFFLWVGCFNLTVIAQAWSFANDVYTPEQGKRLFAIVGVGSSFGAMFGAKLASFLVVVLGDMPMMLAAGATLLACLGIMAVVHRADVLQKAAAPARPEAERSEATADLAQGKPAEGAFRVLLADRYLLLIALLALLLNWVNTTGEYILDRRVEEWARELVATGQSGGLDFKKLVNQFRGNFFFYVNTIGAIVQLFLVSRILKYLGVARALLFLPIIALGSYALMALVPILSFVRVAKIAENSTNYSVQNTTTQALFLPTTREQKYSAKTAIDTFFVRAGDVLSALVVLVGRRLELSQRHFALWNLLLVVAWIFVAYRLGKLFRERTGEGLPAGPLAGAAEAKPALAGTKKA